MKIIKILVISAFALLLGGYLMVVGPTQQVHAGVAQNWGNYDKLGKERIDGSESMGNNSYSTTARLSASASHHVQGYWLSYFCPKRSDLGDPHGSNQSACLQFKNPQFFDTYAGGNSGTQYVTSSRSPMSPFSNCGIYQNDFFITAIDGNISDTYGDYAGGNDANWTTLLAGYYNTGVDCQAPAPAPTATSTPFPTSTATPMPTATETPMPTNTGTPVPTATGTPVPTNTPNPTATPTVPTTNTVHQNCGSNDSLTLQQGTNNQYSDNCNNNSNLNNNNNSQSQNQTQNNNQNVSINLTNNSNNTTTTPTVAPAPTSNSLPSTGTPEIVWSLFGLLPLGLKLRKLA